MAWIPLWCRPAAMAQIQPLAWEPPYATGVALKRRKEEGRRKKEGRKERKKMLKWSYLLPFIPCCLVILDQNVQF